MRAAEFKDAAELRDIETVLQTVKERLDELSQECSQLGITFTRGKIHTQHIRTENKDGSTTLSNPTSARIELHRKDDQKRMSCSGFITLEPESTGKYSISVWITSQDNPDTIKL